MSLNRALNETTKQDWIVWLQGQLSSNNADYSNEGINRVFLTSEDDIDIAQNLMQVMLDTLTNNILTPKP